MSGPGGFDEPLVLGVRELAAVGLAHAIILGIAWFRWRRGRGRASSPDRPG